MNVTPIRPDMCVEHTPLTSEQKRRAELALFFSRDVNAAELDSVRRERDTLKLRIIELESENRTLLRGIERNTRHALDTGRIQGMIGASLFVAVGLTIASIWAI